MADIKIRRGVVASTVPTEYGALYFTPLAVLLLAN